MQWNDHVFAGFSAVQPWITVNPNYRQINVAQQQADPNSVWHFYRRLIALRKANPSLITGRYQLLLENDPQIYAYQRVADDAICTIITNLSARDAQVDLDIAALGECVLHNQQVGDGGAALTASECVSPFLAASFLAAPYSAYVFIQKIRNNFLLCV